MEIHDLWERVAPRLQLAVESGLSIDVVAEFCKSKSTTVRGWLHEIRPAEGARLIRLWHMLAALGHDAPELEELTPLQRLTGRLFAFDVISDDEACDIVGIKKYQDMYCSLRGRDVLRPRYDVDEVSVVHGDALDRAIQELRRQCAWSTDSTEDIPSSPNDIVDEASSSAKELATAEPTPLGDMPVLTLSLGNDPKLALAVLIGVAMPLAHQLVSDATSPEERSVFRDLVGNETLFIVTNLFEQLNSERIRNQVRR